jgi:hypothetical protein
VSSLTSGLEDLADDAVGELDFQIRAACPQDGHSGARESRAQLGDEGALANAGRTFDDEQAARVGTRDLACEPLDIVEYLVSSRSPVAPGVIIACDCPTLRTKPRLELVRTDPSRCGD